MTSDQMPKFATVPALHWDSSAQFGLLEICV